MSHNKTRVYLDHNATTPLHPTLQNKWMDFLQLYGNPSSVHQDSRLPKTYLRESRQKLAKILGCSPLELIFNSGASEANNSILKSIYQYSLISGKNEILVSSVEHPSVMKTAQYLETLGLKVFYIPVSREGQIDLNFIQANLSEKTALVSVMYANNETGTVFPIKEISALAHSVGAYMHSDCVQLLGKSEINFSELNLDYACFSAHKFYALKGLGVTYARKNSPWTPLVHGGGQERSRRGGTENILAVAALNTVLDSLLKCNEKLSQIKKMRDQMESLILQKISNVTITAKECERLGNTSSLVIADVDGETLLMSLDLKGFAVSTGAACSSGNPEPSPVLLSMGLSRAEAQSSLRISLGFENTEQQILDFVETLVSVVTKLRQIKKDEKIESSEHVI